VTEHCVAPKPWDGVAVMLEACWVRLPRDCIFSNFNEVDALGPVGRATVAHPPGFRACAGPPVAPGRAAHTERDRNRTGAGRNRQVRPFESGCDDRDVADAR
jgi:hypothetical protein